MTSGKAKGGAADMARSLAHQHSFQYLPSSGHQPTGSLVDRQNLGKDITPSLNPALGSTEVDRDVLALDLDLATTLSQRAPNLKLKQLEPLEPQGKHKI